MRTHHRHSAPTPSRAPCLATCPSRPSHRCCRRCGDAAACGEPPRSRPRLACRPAAEAAAGPVCLQHAASLHGGRARWWWVADFCKTNPHIRDKLPGHADCNNVRNTSGPCGALCGLARPCSSSCRGIVHLSTHNAITLLYRHYTNEPWSRVVAGEDTRTRYLHWTLFESQCVQCVRLSLLPFSVQILPPESQSE